MSLQQPFYNMANTTQLFCDCKPIRLLEKQRSLSEHALITIITKTIIIDTVLICKCYCNIKLPYTGDTTTDNNNNNNNHYINNNKITMALHLLPTKNNKL